jgi:hypothetical protein
MFEFWLLSAAMNAVLAMTAVGLGVRLTRGAGFGSALALVRYGQRLAFMLLAFALMNCAIHGLSTRQAPPDFALWVQFAFMAVIATSIIRHILGPPIPKDASWRRPAGR